MKLPHFLFGAKRKLQLWQRSNGAVVIFRSNKTPTSLNIVVLSFHWKTTNLNLVTQFVH